MLNTCRVASYWPKGQGEAGYEAAKGDTYRPDRYLYHCHYGGTGHEKRPLRGPTPNRTDGGRCLHGLRIC